MRLREEALEAVGKMKPIEKDAAEDFFHEWSIYDQVLDHNYMHHDEIYRDVQQFLADRYGHVPFALLDLGCGSARHLARALQGRSVSRYVGYDLADTALTEAAGNLAGFDCPVELHKGDLLAGLRTSGEKFDIVFTSFALHHLATGEKSVFFQSAYQRLNENGVLLFIDTMRDDDEDRGLYLDRYCAWLRSRCKTLSAEAFDLLCAHIRSNDFPETTTVVQGMATDAGFSPPIEMNRFGWHHTWCFHRAGGSETTR
jgi:SAM-dependent methyltransferase